MSKNVFIDETWDYCSIKEKNETMKTYTVAGYIDCSTIASGQLIVVYKSDSKFFTQILSQDNRTIIGFRLFELEHYKNDTITPMGDGPEKQVNDSSFFVCKYKNKIILGSSDEQKFIDEIKGQEKRLIKLFFPPELQKLFK